jgi:hypothetical protein
LKLGWAVLLPCGPAALLRRWRALRFRRFAVWRRSWSLRLRLGFELWFRLWWGFGNRFRSRRRRWRYDSNFGSGGDRGRIGGDKADLHGFAGDGQRHRPASEPEAKQQCGVAQDRDDGADGALTGHGADFGWVSMAIFVMPSRRT